MNPPDMPPTAPMLYTKHAYKDFVQTLRKCIHLRKFQCLELPIKLADENPQNPIILTNYKTKIKKNDTFTIQSKNQNHQQFFSQ